MNPMKNNLENKIPATIITGFLGAGKTTLLNHLIKNSKKIKFAIIENEFGDINIDKDLIVNFEDDIYDLKNGCVCCSLNDEFANTLLHLFESDKDFESILVETTGIADPNSVAASFFENIIKDNIYYNGTVCLIDSLSFESTFSNEIIAAKQLAFADIVILNKTDLVDKLQLNSIKKAVKLINPDAELIFAENAEVDVNKILNIARSDQINIIEQSYEHFKSNIYISYSFRFDEPFDLDLFKYSITILTNKFKNNLLRIKGMIYNDLNEKYIFQSIKDLGEFKKKEMEIGEVRHSKIVFIGKELDKHIIEKELNAALIN